LICPLDSIDVYVKVAVLEPKSCQGIDIFISAILMVKVMRERSSIKKRKNERLFDHERKERYRT